MHDENIKEPESIGEALERKRLLTRDIMFIERQLADDTRTDSKGRRLSEQEFKRWRGGAHSSLVFKKVEHAYLKDWIVSRRRRIQAEELCIFDANDPRELLLKARSAILSARSGDDSELGVVFDAIDQFLNHAA